MMHRNHTSLALIVAISLVALGSSSTVDARRVTPGRWRRQKQMQSSGRQLLRYRHLKQEGEEENDDNGGGEGKAGIDVDKKDKKGSKMADPTAGPTIGAADDDIDTNTDTTSSTVSRTIGNVDGDINGNSTQTTGTSQPTTAPTNTTTTSPSPTAAPTVETYNCYENNPCLDAAERQVYYYRHPDPTKFVQCGAAATCFTMGCHEGLVWSLDDTACVFPAAASP